MTLTRYDTDHIRKTCSIAYRASAEPQCVHLNVKWAQENRTIARLLIAFQRFLQEGVSADRHFSPLDGSTEWIEAPHMQGKMGPLSELNAVLKLSSTSTWSVQSLIGMLLPNATELSLRGDLPVDGTELSLSTDRFLARDAANGLFPERWPDLPFALEVDEAPRGAALRVTFAGDVPKDYTSGPVGIGERMPLLAGLLTFSYWDRGHDQVASVSMMPKLAQTARELSATWARCQIHPEPFTNILVNHLIWVHHKEIPIESVLVRTS